MFQGGYMVTMAVRFLHCHTTPFYLFLFYLFLLFFSSHSLLPIIFHPTHSFPPPPPLLIFPVFFFLYPFPLSSVSSYFPPGFDLLLSHLSYHLPFFSFSHFLFSTPLSHALHINFIVFISFRMELIIN